MPDLDYDSKESATPSLRAYNRSKRMYVMFSGAVLVMYSLLVPLLRLKYSGMKETPFETHSLLIHTSIAAFLLASLASMVLFYDYLPSLNKKPLSPVIYMITKVVFAFSGIVALLSILLLLIIG